MKKNLLIFISIMFLNSASSYADTRPISKLAVEREVRGDTEQRTGVYTQVHEDRGTVSTTQFSSAVEFEKRSSEKDLPTLPPSFEIQQETQTSSESNISLWQRLRAYMGFGDKKKLAQDEQVKALEPIQKIEDAGSNVVEAKPTEDTESSIKNTDIAPPAPAGSSDEGPVAVKPLGDTKNDQDVTDQLQLPEGFNETTDKANVPAPDDLNTKAANIGNLEVTTDKNHSSESPQITDQTEVKIPEISEAAKPDVTADIKNTETSTSPTNAPSISQTSPVESKVQELGAPQLPEAVEDKAVKEINAAKEEKGIEPAKQEPPIKEESETSVDKQPIAKQELPTATQPEINQEESNNHGSSMPLLNNSPAQSGEPETVISKYKKEIEAKSGKIIEVPKISEGELSLKNSPKVADLKASDLEEFDARQFKFVNDEAQVLALPDDDVVLGELTNEAKLDQMDLRSYIEKFWDNYYNLAREPERLEIEHFIDTLDNEDDLCAESNEKL